MKSRRGIYEGIHEIYVGFHEIYKGNLEREPIKSIRGTHEIYKESL